MHTHLSHDTQKMPNSEEEQIATDAAEREQRVLVHYAEPRGGKERTAGLKLKEQRKISLLFFVTVVIIVNLENLVLKQKSSGTSLNSLNSLYSLILPVSEDC